MIFDGCVYAFIIYASWMFAYICLELPFIQTCGFIMMGVVLGLFYLKLCEIADGGRR